MFYRTSAAVLVILAALSGQPVTAQVPLSKAHAHNDYRHARPLQDALKRGFCSVEADIFLVNNTLLVAHDITDLRAEKTLEKLYLDPLRALAQKHNGRIFPNGPIITLLIDIKLDGERLYPVLHRTLQRYKEMLCRVENGVVHEGAVRVVISGDRPWDRIRETEPRFAGIDGRLQDIDSKEPAHLMPLISDRWTSHFKWNGTGTFPEEERTRLHDIVRRAHAKGRRVRFWATPENTRLWLELVNADVDHINTDQLDELKDFLLQQ